MTDENSASDAGGAPGVPGDPADSPYWRGINHLALVTNDMDATIRFYCGVLGCRLIGTIGNAGFRHYFFEFGPQCSVAFFEYKGVEIPGFTKMAGFPDLRAPQFDHLSFNVADEDALHRLRTRLEAAGCEVTEIVDHVFIRSIYFNDNNGISLEASWWVVDATGRPVDYEDTRMFADRHPPAAFEELRDTGSVSSTPRTTLTV